MSKSSGEDAKNGESSKKKSKKQSKNELKNIMTGKQFD